MKVYTEIYLSTNIIIKSDSADMSMSITEAMDKLESHWGKTPYVAIKQDGVEVLYNKDHIVSIKLLEQK